jgi:hypothetical protein
MKTVLYFLLVVIMCVPGILLIVVLGSTIGMGGAALDDRDHLILWTAGGVLLGTWLLLYVIAPRIDGKNAPKVHVIELGYSRQDCDNVILDLARKADARKTGRELGGGKIEVIVPQGAILDYDADINLKHIEKHPESGIRIVRK